MNTLWYQEAVINGLEMPHRRQTDTSARRWQRLIRPLLPPAGPGQLFLDLGCNAGFYSRQAIDLGYRAWGVERDPAFLGHARYWEQEVPKGLRLIEADLTSYDPPACHVALLANVHYWLSPEELAGLVARLRKRALYLIVVGRHRALSQHRSPCDEGALRQTLAGWEIGKTRSSGKLYSLCAHNPDLLDEDVTELLARQVFGRNGCLVPALRQYIDLVAAGAPFEASKTALVHYLLWRRFPGPQRRLERYRQMILNALRDRLITLPLVIREDGRLIDGCHRLITAERLGIRRVLCRRLSSI